MFNKKHIEALKKRVAALEQAVQPKISDKELVRQVTKSIIEGISRVHCS